VLGVALMNRDAASDRERGLEMLTQFRDMCLDGRFAVSELAVADFWTAYERDMRGERPVWAPGVRILGRPPIIRRRSRTSSIVDRAGPVEWPNRENSHATGVCYAARARPAPTTIAEQLHAHDGWVQAGPCQAPVGVVGRSVEEAAVATSGSVQLPSRRRRRHSRS
jgi:hypothetical protein